MQGRSRRDPLRRLLQPLAFRRKSVIRTSLNNYSPRPRRQRRGVVEFAADSPLEENEFEPSVPPQKTAFFRSAEILGSLDRLAAVCTALA